MGYAGGVYQSLPAGARDCRPEPGETGRPNRPGTSMFDPNSRQEFINFRAQCIGLK